MAIIKDEEIGTDVKPGKPKIGKNPSKAEVRRLYAREGKSIREIGNNINVSSCPNMEDPFS